MGDERAGKSNILESIYYFARGRSFRGGRDSELIRFGADYATSSLTYRRDGYENDTVLDCVIPKSGKKKLRKNSVNLSSAAEMMGLFRAVLFCPKDLSLVTGGPLERRTFLDVALSQLSATYLTYLRRYTKALTERNALLKRASAGASPLPNGKSTPRSWQNPREWFVLTVTTMSPCSRAKSDDIFPI